MLVSINSFLAEAKSRLLALGVDTDIFELRLLLAEAIGIDYKNMAHGELDISELALNKFNAMLIERSLHKPVDKIIGCRGFYKYDFIVNENVLSPRPDTEILVENILLSLQANDYKQVLELGVGSGCVIGSILADAKAILATGVDISLSALEVARINAERLNVLDRLSLFQADWFANDFVDNFTHKFDLIVSNPPYITHSEISTLSKELKQYDPLVALDGGEDGLDSYRRIAEISVPLLRDKGMIFLEVGETQAQSVIDIFTSQGFRHDRTYNDLSGIKRCVSFKK